MAFVCDGAVHTNRSKTHVFAQADFRVTVYKIDEYGTYDETRPLRNLDMCQGCFDLFLRGSAKPAAKKTPPTPKKVEVKS